MKFKRANTDDQINLRKQEIISACDILYTTGDYDAVTLQAISNITSIGRTGIYNYYSTKDEILLDLIEREQLKTSKEMNNEFNKYYKLSKEEYADILTKCFINNSKYLKLTSILFTTIENGCSLEKLTSFSNNVQEYFNTILNSLEKYFPESSINNRRKFSFHLHSFITGAYPYLHPTHNRIQALLIANPSYKVPDFYDTCYNAILLLLGNI